MERQEEVDSDLEREAEERFNEGGREPEYINQERKRGEARLGREKVGSRDKVSGQGHRMKFQGREGHKVFKGTIEKSGESQRYEGIQRAWVRREPEMGQRGETGGGSVERGLWETGGGGRGR